MAERLFELRTCTGRVVNSEFAETAPAHWLNDNMKSFKMYVTERDVSEPRRVRFPDTHNLVPKHDNCVLAPCGVCEGNRMYHTEVCGCHNIKNANFAATRWCIQHNLNDNKLLTLCKPLFSRNSDDRDIIITVAHRNQPFKSGDYIILPRGGRRTTRYRITKCYGRTSSLSGVAYRATFDPR